MDIKIPKYGPLSEAGGTDVQFCPCQKTGMDSYEGITTPFICKDYLTDFFWNHATGKPVDVYGFKYNGEFKNLYKGKNNARGSSTVLLAIRVQKGNKTDTDFKKISELQENVENFLNEVQGIMSKVYKFKKTKTNISDDETTILLFLDIKWFWQPFLVSFLTFLVRVGLYYKSGDVIAHIKGWNKTDNDFSYKNPASKLLEFIVAGNKPVQEYTQFSSCRDCHNSSGIVSLINSGLKAENKKTVTSKTGAVAYIDLNS